MKKYVYLFKEGAALDMTLAEKENLTWWQGC